jgi:hypothetical protein
MVLAQAPVDTCSDPLDYQQDSIASIACVIHLSVLVCFVEWINEVNCSAVMII